MIKIQISTVFLIFLGLLIGLDPSSLSAQTEALTSTSTSSLFESMLRSDVLQLGLKTDQKKLIREKAKETYQPATLSYKDADGNPVKREIEVKTRGNMRLKTCYYPPLRLKIAEEEIESEGLKPYNKLKLVVGCKAGSEYEQMVLREYLIYKIRNIITDYSFRVQLISLHMEDTEGKEKPRDILAFVIEDEDEMAERLGGKMFDPRSVSRNALERDSYDMLSMFQYLVGNTDWFVLNKHNTKFLRTEDPPSIIPIAYDFDFAGLVNTPYAVPNEKMPIKSVLDRFFIGDCGEEGHYDEVISKIVAKKSAIFDLVNNFTYLSDRSRGFITKYLNKSFENLENPKFINKEIKRGCGWSPIPK